MAVEFRLKELAQEFGINLHGMSGELQQLLNVQRQAISRLINSKTMSISLEDLELLSDWLLKVVDGSRHEELRAALPGALFSFTGIWDRLLDSKELTVFLGERRPMPDIKGMLGGLRWISGADAEAATGLIQRLSMAGGRFQFKWQNIPFHYANVLPQSGDSKKTAAKKAVGKTPKERDAQLDVDIAQVSQIFETMKKKEGGGNLIIGSQRINLLVELVVAQLFGATAFRELPRSKTAARPPFYIHYRSDDPLYPPSCFGGDGKRIDLKKGLEPGIHYRHSPKVWKSFPWIQSEQTAGIAIIHRDLALNLVTVCLIGYSGRGTMLLSRLFQEQPRRFGPLHVVSKTQRLGVFACRFTQRSDHNPEDTSLAAQEIEIVALSKDVCTGGQKGGKSQGNAG